jgi:hypothetical protein
MHRARDHDRPAVAQDAARVGLVCAAESLDERGLAAAVLAEKGLDLACAKLK